MGVVFFFFFSFLFSDMFITRFTLAFLIFFFVDLMTTLVNCDEAIAILSTMAMKKAQGKEKSLSELCQSSILWKFVNFC